MFDEWRTVPGFHGRYEVSNDGRVRSRQFIDKRGVTHPPRDLKVTTSKHVGYPMVFIRHDGKNRHLLVHRLVASAFLDTPHSDATQVNHKDGVKTNNRLDNLEWVTPLGNTRHAMRIGLLRFEHLGGSGDDCPASKLTESQVRVIKERLRAGEQYRRIAKDFGVRYGTIGHIKYGRTWRNVE